MSGFGRRLALAVCILAALVLAPIAVAATQYAGSSYWVVNQSGASSYSDDWFTNDFAKGSSGYDTTVTMIDNTGYDWHETVRNTSQVTHTAFGLETVKAHCLSHSSGFSGSCWVSS